MGLQWVEDSEEGDLRAGSDRSSSSESKGRAGKGKPRCPPGCTGIVVTDPIPRGWGHPVALASPLLMGCVKNPVTALTFKCLNPVHFHSALILPFFSFIYIAICSLSFHLSPGESCQNLTTKR